MKANKSYKILIGLIGLAILLGLIYYTKHTNFVNKANPQNQIASQLDAEDKASLEAQVKAKVDKETNGNWDKTIQIDQVDKSQKAVHGSWWAHDKWEWFAWKSIQGEWQVLISMDGWDCSELDNISYDYQKFFNDNTYKLPGGERYCYDHQAKKSSDVGQKIFVFPEITGSVVTLSYPADYTIKKDTEQNRRGSFVSYDFEAQNAPEVHLAEIQFFTRASISEFLTRCEDNFCFEGDYPDLQRFDGQRTALANEKGYGKYQYVIATTNDWLVANYSTTDQVTIREYTTFVGEDRNTKVDLWIMMPNGTPNNKADELFNSLNFNNAPVI